MTKLFGHVLSLEMALLWVLECVLSALVIYAFIAMPGSSPQFGPGVQYSAVQHAGVFAVTIGATAVMLGLYRPETCFHTRRLLLTTIASGIIGFPALLLVGHLFRVNPEFLVGPDPLWPCKILVSWLACLVATRLAFTLAVRNSLMARRGLVTGSGAGLHRLDDAELRERQLGRVDLATIEPGWLASARALGCSRSERVLRRSGDILIASLFLVFTAPLMVLTALAVRLDSPGPVLYRQERVGLHGRSFTLLKFRSMRADAELSSGPSWAAKSDPRVTRTGSFMRRTRIDELPQIFNVLSGEMSFIGPRPERPHFVAQLEAVIPHYGDRAHVKPGLTGWAQVNFPYGASVEDARMKLAYDLYYIRHRTFLLDIMILLSTVRVILFQEGAR